MAKRFGVIIPVAIIISFSLSTIWSSAPKLFLSQLGFVVIGIALVFLISRIDIYLFRPISLALYIAGIVLLLLTLFFGNSIRGTTRWLYLGPISLQTSEIIKPLFVIFWADFIANNPPNKFINIIKYTFLVLIPATLIFLQPDLGSSIITISLGFGLLIISGLPLKYLLSAVALAIVTIFIVFPHLHSYQQERLSTFINPYIDPQGKGYNTIQSTIAIGSGKLLGRGIRQGGQSQLKFLPERHADFAFASFAEEFGVTGATFLILSYGLLLRSFYKISLSQKDNFLYYIASSIFFILSLQVLINISVNLGLLPVTGIPLPFFSYGGSSIISHLILTGFILSLARNDLKV